MPSPREWKGWAVVDENSEALDYYGQPPILRNDKPGSLMECERVERVERVVVTVIEDNDG